MLHNNKARASIRSFSKLFLRRKQVGLMYLPLSLLLATAQLTGAAEVEQNSRTNDPNSQSDSQSSLVVDTALSLSKVKVIESSLMAKEGYMITSKQLGNSVFRREAGEAETTIAGITQKVPMTVLELAVNSKDVEDMVRDNPGRFNIYDEEHQIVGIERLGFVTMKNALAGLIYIKDEKGKNGCVRLPFNHPKAELWSDLDSNISAEPKKSRCSLSFKIKVLDTIDPETRKRKQKATGEICRYPDGKILNKDSQICHTVLPNEDLGSRTFFFTKHHEDRLLKRIIQDAKNSNFTSRYFAYESSPDKRVFLGKANDIFGAFLPEFRTLTLSFMGNWAGLNSEYVNDVSSARFKEQIIFAQAKPEKLQEAFNEQEKESNKAINLQEAGIEGIHVKYFQAKQVFDDETELFKEEFDYDKPDFLFEISARSMELSSTGMTITFTPIDVSKGVLEFSDNDQDKQVSTECQEQLQLAEDSFELSKKLYECNKKVKMKDSALDSSRETVAAFMKAGSSDTIPTKRLLALIKVANTAFSHINKYKKQQNPNAASSDLYLRGISIQPALDSPNLWNFIDQLPEGDEIKEAHTAHPEPEPKKYNEDL